MGKVQRQVVHDFHSRLWLGLALLVMALTAPLPAAANGAAPFGPWRAQLLRDHPLAGRIFDAASGAPIGREELLARVRSARVLLLGEVHDNPDHHRIQAALLKAFAAGRRKPPAVVFEMIPTDMQRRLDMILKLPEVDADMVFDAVRWDGSGWPPRALYRPLMEAVLAVRAPIIAAGVPREAVKRIAKRGLSALSRAKIGALRLGPLPPDLQRALEKEIVKSHCDMISPEVARRMSAVQRVRDATLARAVARGYARQGSAVLIAGDGHVRKDMAVPLYLKRLSEGGFPPNERLKTPPPLVIWQAEVREKAKRLADVLPEGASAARLADVVIVTPRARREDPCARFRRFMQRRREGK